MQEEMKSCPFCGGESVELKHNSAKYGWFYYVECVSCGGRTRGICRPRKELPNYDEEDVNEWDNRYADTVVMLWNRRA